MQYMLDTSVCVSLIRGRAVKARLPATSECVLSVITVAELEIGIRRSVGASQTDILSQFLLEEMTP